MTRRTLGAGAASGNLFGRDITLSGKVLFGGASGPEVAALAAFRGDARLRVVHARSTESYDADAKAPDGATVHFRGVDSRAGPITKYTVVEPYERAH